MSKPGSCIEFPDRYGTNMDEFMQQAIREGRQLLLIFPDAPFFQRDEIFDDSFASLQLEPHHSHKWKISYDQVYLRAIGFAIEDDTDMRSEERDDLIGRINKALEQL